jgi:hypothetical protein
MAVLTVDLNILGWLISRGKEVFYSVKTEPDSFIQQVVIKNPMNLRVLRAMNAFKNKTGEELYSFIDYESLSPMMRTIRCCNLIGMLMSPQTMSKICPVLYENLGNKTVTSQTTYCSANPIFILIEFTLLLLLCSIAPGYKVERERHHLFHTQGRVLPPSLSLRATDWNIVYLFWRI